MAGAIPLLRPLRESLAGDEVRRVLGIVNGTTNYILDKMDTSGADFGAALSEAQDLGYAEKDDPGTDVEGYDAAAKAAILASIAFHTEVTAADVYREGITGVTAADIASAKTLGCVVKLLAICERCHGGVSARVYPAMIPREHPLAAVRGAYNAVFVEAESAGRLMFYGAGAGGQPTASAVLGDIVTVARRNRTSSQNRFGIRPVRPSRLHQLWGMVSRWIISPSITPDASPSRGSPGSSSGSVARLRTILLPPFDRLVQILASLCHRLDVAEHEIRDLRGPGRRPPPPPGGAVGPDPGDDRLRLGLRGDGPPARGPGGAC